jgi:hypothetical protein
MTLVHATYTFIVLCSIYLLSGCAPTVPGIYKSTMPTPITSSFSQLLPSTIRAEENLVIIPLWHESWKFENEARSFYGEPISMRGQDLDQVPEIIPAKLNYGLYGLAADWAKYISIRAIFIIREDGNVYDISRTRQGIGSNWDESSQLGTTPYCRDKISNTIYSGVLDKMIFEYLPPPHLYLQEIHGGILMDWIAGAQYSIKCHDWKNAYLYVEHYFPIEQSENKQEVMNMLESYPQVLSGGLETFSVDALNEIRMEYAANVEFIKYVQKQRLEYFSQIATDSQRKSAESNFNTVFH